MFIEFLKNIESLLYIVKTLKLNYQDKIRDKIIFCLSKQLINCLIIRSLKDTYFFLFVTSFKENIFASTYSYTYLV